MNLLEKSDQEILDIANPLWDNLVNSSNKKDYFEFVKDFSAKMLFGANEVEIGKQWASNKLLTSLDENKMFLGCFQDVFGMYLEYIWHHFGVCLE